MKRFHALAIVALAIPSIIVGCGKPVETVHNLTPDEVRSANIKAAAFFGMDMPAGADAGGNLVLKKGAFTVCRPQDSNSNGLVTCTGMVPNPKALGQFIEKVVYCGYKSGEGAVAGCNDKDQT